VSDPLALRGEPNVPRAVDPGAAPAQVRERRGHAIHRFLVRAGDAGYVGYVDGGRLLEWIDKAGYDAAARWSGRYCDTAYVGNLHVDHPISIGELVELHAQVVHTGTSSMHILVTVYSSQPSRGEVIQSAQCLTVFVAVDAGGGPVPVPEYRPQAIIELQRNRQARARIDLRRRIEAEFAAANYTTEGSAPDSTLRFLAAPTNANWGGKVHGGRIMRWIDEAGYVCGSQWTAGPVIASYFGGIRFYRPVQIGQVVEVNARLIYTGPFSVHFGVHVTTMNTDAAEHHLAAHAVAVFVGFGAEGKRSVPRWRPVSAEDVALWRHAERLIELRTGAEPFTSGSTPPADAAPQHVRITETAGGR
jgi:acyl-CoA hydrolase